MTLYRITLEIHSSLVTLLKGDTLWGHIAWGIANREGDEAVAAFLEQEKSGQPPLIVSSAFPKDMICKPLPEPKLREGTLTREKYADIKKNKKIQYEAASQYFSNTPDMSYKYSAFFKTRQFMHNVINRATNTVLDQGLYAVEEYWAEISEWDVYALSLFDAARVTQLFEMALENGYGADTSTGKGRISVKQGAEPVVAKNKGSATYMALGPFVRHQNIENLRADIFVRTGRIGGMFASVLSPYKKTVLLYDEGAVFTSKTPLEYAGALLSGVHKDKRICQSAFTPVIAIA
ncbi:MAG: CRISPR-associated protein Csm4 [Treponema sp.]|nr:CRISPR-associated protein Csm4 [Treponema sp.]